MIKKRKKIGFILIFVTFLILSVMIGIILTITAMAFRENKDSLNISKSIQSYYTSEGGVEDLLLRLKRSPAFPPSSYTLNVGNGVADISISDSVGGQRVIESEGDVQDRIRKTKIIYTIDADGISFRYGAQVGAGGMEMGNGSVIEGNVFSNGSIIGSGTISNSVVVAGNGNKIEGLSVGEDAAVHTCKDSDIGGDLTYVSGGSIVGCSVGGAIGSSPDQIDPEDLPISSGQIDDWKADALAGGVLDADVAYLGGPNYLGPKQIGTPDTPKNLTLNNGSVLKIKGTVYITGNLVLNNNSSISLDLSSYGSMSGVIIVGGKIIVKNNSIVEGSSLAGSYLMLLSTNSSLDPATPAISVSNNAQGAIFYTTSGLILLNNNMKVKEVTGYKIKINNNAEVEYESGLASIYFSSGPGGSWKVESWKETE